MMKASWCEFIASRPSSVGAGRPGVGAAHTQAALGGSAAAEAKHSKPAVVAVEEDSSIAAARAAVGRVQERLDGSAARRRASC